MDINECTRPMNAAVCTNSKSNEAKVKSLFGLIMNYITSCEKLLQLPGSAREQACDAADSILHKTYSRTQVEPI